ncbi:MAG: 16S rRNA (adenine(1518)-N(6)/adenine(1519)-N(6))-dimethyltransferase RsmA [Oscillospiraceae bacterium]
MDLCDIRDIKALLGRHGFHFSKSMGQNFLIEGWVPQQIAEAAGCGENIGVLEIGPGIGPLTAQLAKRCGKVVSVELDKALLPVLAETMEEFDNVEIVPGDIMKLDIPTLIADKFNSLTPIACANLPYNITTPVITALLEAGCFARITVMIQREVALRICAAPGTPDYGAFSVLCQYHAQCERLFDVEPECFLPAPKVTSSVIRLTPRPKPAEVEDEDAFFRVVRAAFAQRRKTLINALSSAFSSTHSKDDLRSAITACGLPEDVRGERLGIPEFAALAKILLSGKV